MIRILEDYRSKFPNVPGEIAYIAAKHYEDFYDLVDAFEQNDFFDVMWEREQFGNGQLAIMDVRESDDIQYEMQVTKIKGKGWVVRSIEEAELR